MIREENPERRIPVMLAILWLAAGAGCLTSERTSRGLSDPNATIYRPRRTKEYWQQRLESLAHGITKARVIGFVNKHRSAPTRTDRELGLGQGKHGFYQLDKDWTLHIRYSAVDGDASPPWPQDAKITFLEVIGLADLSNEIPDHLFLPVKLVHDSSTLDGGNFNPALLIEAVNALRLFDKEHVLEALRTYSRLATSDRARRPLYDLDEYRISLVSRLLFVRRDGKKTMPAVEVGETLIDLEAPSDKWPMFPLALEKGVPFLVVSGYITHGPPWDPMGDLDYYRHRCELRPRPLIPSAPYLDAANSFISSERWQSLTFVDWAVGARMAHEKMLREQALRAIDTAARERANATVILSE